MTTRHATLASATRGWAWPMWLGLAIWRTQIKAVWEQEPMHVARKRMRGYVPDSSDVLAFEVDLPRLQRGARFVFRNGVVLVGGSR